MNLKPLIPMILMCAASFNFAAVLAEPSPAKAPEVGGHLEAVVDGKAVSFPMLKTDMDVHISGTLATVKVKQTFSNPTNKPLHATYLFPLPTQAAVHAMQMRVGDELIEAKIKKKAEAQKTFDEAKSEGKAASLLTQHRPNMFTQQVANLMPNRPIEVTLEYIQTVPRVDHQYELVLPLVVGPRYIPAHISPKEQLPAYPQVGGLTAPKSIETDRVSIQVALDSPLPIQTVSSPTHALIVNKSDAQACRIGLEQGRIIDNRDFVLHYRLAGNATAAGVLTEKSAQGKTFSLVIEPPAHVPPETITPRELVFVMDTSGSMSGEPLDASKIFMAEALRHMRPTDYFRIIRFSNNATEFTSAPVLANEENIKNGLAYVNSLTADGGTEAMAAINQALDVSPKAGTMRMVVFLTDGYIGNEYEVLNQLKKKIGKGRVYALGVGSSVNRFLLDEMAIQGHGFVRYIDPTSESLKDASLELANKLETPVLTDISIDWGDWKVKEVYPHTLPDLFGGDALQVMGQYENDGSHTLQIHGLVNGKPVTLPVHVTVSGRDTSASEELSVIWARTKIEDLMRRWRAPVSEVQPDKSLDHIEAEVTRLGLAHKLVTDWTSFVAVSRKVVNPNAKDTQAANVPLPMVDGVTEKAYGELDPAFAGSSVPEPHDWALLILFCLFMTWVMSLHKTHIRLG